MTKATDMLVFPSTAVIKQNQSCLRHAALQFLGKNSGSATEMLLSKRETSNVGIVFAGGSKYIVHDDKMLSKGARCFVKLKHIWKRQMDVHAVAT